MNVKILYFAALRERMKKSEEVVACSDSETAKDVAARIVGFTDCITYAVNDEQVDAGYHLSDGDTLALIPPMAGG